MPNLNGKVAIVTGASKGIGAAIAKGLAAAGARVVVNFATDRDGAERVLAAIEAADGRGLVIKADVSSHADVAAMFELTILTFGRLDILVNNAGVYRDTPFESATEAEFHRIYNTNVLGPILTMQEAIKHFGASGGTIINIATSGVSSKSPMRSIYNSSKAALVNISQVLSNELGHRNIRVNVVAPGPTETEGVQAMGILDGPIVRSLIDATPLGRLGQPADIAGPVVFLASDEARWMTGEVLYASGGFR